MKKFREAKDRLDIRIFRRYPKEFDALIGIGGRRHRAKTLSYSLSGLSLLIHGSPPIERGTIISVDVEELDISQKVRVIWKTDLEGVINIGVLRLGVLNGSLRHYRFSDVLIGLQRSLKTGILHIEVGRIRKRLYIKNGNMIGAWSNQREDRLGDILLAEQIISRESYVHAGEIKRRSKKEYGTILVETGIINPSELKNALELQSRRIIESLFGLQEGNFRFAEGTFTQEEPVSLTISTANLIYKEMKKTADISLIKKYLLDSVIDFSSTPMDLFQNIHLDREDRKILSLIDGRTAVRDLIALGSNRDAETLKSIYALLEARIIEIKKEGDEPSGVDPEEVLEKSKNSPEEKVKQIEEMYSRYIERDYYSVLRIDASASHQRIKTAYYKVAKEFHPDLHYDLPNDMKRMLTEVFSYMTNAYMTLKDPILRKKYDDCRKEYEYMKCIRVNEKRVCRNAEIARSKNEEAKDSFAQGKYEEAAHLFAQAIYFDNTLAEYHYGYGCSLRRLDKGKEAIHALNEALNLDQNHAGILAEIGHAYLGLGYSRRAKGNFSKALRIDSSNKKAKMGMEILKDSS